MARPRNENRPGREKIPSAHGALVEAPCFGGHAGADPCVYPSSTQPRRRSGWAGTGACPYIPERNRAGMPAAGVLFGAKILERNAIDARDNNQRARRGRHARLEIRVLPNAARRVRLAAVPQVRTFIIDTNATLRNPVRLLHLVSSRVIPTSEEYQAVRNVGIGVHEERIRN